jgi:hypothetical protein
LRQISNDLKRNTVCDEDRIWLAEALYKIYEGADANFILDIEGGRGQRRENTHRNHMIDLAMHYAAGLHEKKLGGGKTVKESIEIASKIFGLFFSAFPLGRLSFLLPFVFGILIFPYF